MSQLKNILEYENNRTTTEACAVMRLVQEGTFLRAYEWSAWLCVRCFPDLKVTHRILKGGEDIVFVGFPSTSLERYTPKGTTEQVRADGRVDLVLPSSLLPLADSVADMQTEFTHWKQAQPLTEASKKKADEERRAAEREAHPRLTSIMVDILAYPVEQHSPMECMAFLSGVKQRIAQII